MQLQQSLVVGKFWIPDKMRVLPFPLVIGAVQMLLKIEFSYQN